MAGVVVESSTVKTLTVAEAKSMESSALLELASANDGVVLTENGEKRYFVGAIDELALEAHALSQNADFMAYLEACIARGDREGSLTLAEARRRWSVE